MVYSSMLLKSARGLLLVRIAMSLKVKIVHIITWMIFAELVASDCRRLQLAAHCPVLAVQAHCSSPTTVHGQAYVSFDYILYVSVMCFYWNEGGRVVTYLPFRELIAWVKGLS